MKTWRGLFDRLIDPEAFERAALAACRGKRARPDIAWFLFRREAVLARLRADLAAGTWRPGGFTLLPLRDPKPRLIARAPIEDRLVHAGLVRAMTPALLGSLTDDAFACRPGYGTHRAVLRLQAHARRFRFALHLDVRSYFPSVDLAILQRLLARRIRDRRFLEVVARVLESGRGLYDAPAVRTFSDFDADWPPPGQGLPIGAYTSQVFASWLYLDGLDHYVKRALKVPGYVRYVDDLFLFGRGRAELKRWRAACADWLWTERRLRLKRPRAPVLSTRCEVHALGYAITHEAIRPLRRTWKRLRQRTRDGLYRPDEAPDPERSLASAAGVIFFG